MISDLPSVSEELFPVAKKIYACCECRKQIEIGETYHYFKGCWDGKWAKFRTCLTCSDLRDELGDCVDGWPPFGDLMEWKKESERMLTK